MVARHCSLFQFSPKSGEKAIHRRGEIQRPRSPLLKYSSEYPDN
ncbi:hypothetical protein HMPREF0043_02173 [Actinobaculum sp. oral taxon 183 str. F0552]|nr:hypothetical protein HMPREF0043_02173 [Actinobaculum sp. oral taxon 183 str. F0552]